MNFKKKVLLFRKIWYNHISIKNSKKGMRGDTIEKANIFVAIYLCIQNGKFFVCFFS